ncbi:hypothetical protein [Crystallibacter degradans]|uniref:hypothetical protein n=1 Tax=Crystallibacter degradans TaxID=2726743 RepID=UPI0014736B62|nr:hypothetical protein [Arthrobacter sp. SF27]NMR28454.1 hypothetical protein [Arthrobacter sp. SF27]
MEVSAGVDGSTGTAVSVGTAVSAGAVDPAGASVPPVGVSVGVSVPPVVRASVVPGAGSAEPSDGIPEEAPSGSDTDDDAVDGAAASVALTSRAGGCVADATDTSGRSAACAGKPEASSANDASAAMATRPVRRGRK